MVSSTPRPYFTPGKDLVPIVQEAGWATGLVWTGGKSRPAGIRSPGRPARSQSLIPTELPGPQISETDCCNVCAHVQGVAAKWLAVASRRVPRLPSVKC